MDHAEQALDQAARVGEYDRRRTSSDADMVTDALLAATHALLDIADAIRQQGITNRLAAK